jgi:hypothetical protein
MSNISLKTICADTATAVTATWRQVQTMRSGVRYNPEQLIDSLNIYVCVSHEHWIATCMS